MRVEAINDIPIQAFAMHQVLEANGKTEIEYGYFPTIACIERYLYSRGKERLLVIT